MTTEVIKRSPCCNVSVWKDASGAIRCMRCNRPCVKVNTITQYRNDDFYSLEARSEVRSALNASLSACMLMGRSEHDPLVRKLRRALALIDGGRL